MRASRGMGDINPAKEPKANKPVTLKKGGWIAGAIKKPGALHKHCLLYTSPSPRD